MCSKYLILGLLLVFGLLIVDQYVDVIQRSKHIYVEECIITSCRVWTEIIKIQLINDPEPISIIDLTLDSSYIKYTLKTESREQEREVLENGNHCYYRTPGSVQSCAFTDRNKKELLLLDNQYHSNNVRFGQFIIIYCIICLIKLFF
jgi:hypothetical protein